MGFRFRKSLKILPGVRLNLSKKGIGTSVGVKGFHISNGPSGSRMTTSLPGTGLSHSTNLSAKKHRGTRTTVKANYSQSDFVVAAPKTQIDRGPYYLKPWRAVTGIFSFITTLSVFAGDLPASDMLITFLILAGLSFFLLFPWIRRFFDKVKEIYTRNDRLAENIDQKPPEKQ